MIVYRLTIEQAEVLMGVEYAKDCFFSPTLDAESEYFISVEEVEQCENKEFEWLREFKKTEVKQKIYERPQFSK